MRASISLHFSSIEGAALRFLSHSICSLLTAAKRAGGKIKLRGAINLVHRLIQRLSLVLLLLESCVFEILFEIAIRSFKCIILLSTDRSRIGHRPFFGGNVECSLKQSVVCHYVVELFRVILR